MTKATHKVRSRSRTLIGALTVVALVGVVTGGVWLPAIGRWLAMPATQLHRADALAVFAGNASRTEYGVELFRQGLAPELWHTGYANRQEHTTDVVVRGDLVPVQSFRYLSTTSTWTDGQQIAAAIRAHKLHSVIIVTDWWHSRRALCATEQQLGGYSVEIMFEPSPALAGPADWWRNAEIRSDVGRELVKLGYYALRYGMTPWGC